MVLITSSPPPGGTRWWGIRHGGSGEYTRYDFFGCCFQGDENAGEHVHVWCCQWDAGNPLSNADHNAYTKCTVRRTGEKKNARRWPLNTGTVIHNNQGFEWAGHRVARCFLVGRALSADKALAASARARCGRHKLTKMFIPICWMQRRKTGHHRIHVKLSLH